MMGQTPSLPAVKTLVRGASQLLTLRGPAGPRRGAALGELGIIQDGAVLISGGKILEIGPSRRLENLSLARDAQEINAAGRVVMPGFVDSRTQPVLEPALPARRLASRAQSVLNGMARHGTTAIAASVRSGLSRSATVAALRILSASDGQPLDVVRDYYLAAAADAEAVCSELLPLLARRKLAQQVSVDCDALGELAVRRVLEQVQRLGLRATVCAAASACVLLAIELQAAAVVLPRVESAGETGLSLPRPVCTLLPSHVYRRQLNGLPARALIDASAAVALASGFGFDGCPTYNMQMVISLACSEMGLTPAEAISAATINGAHALGRGHLCGSLEPSKAADLLLLNVADYRDLPAQFGINHVHLVLKNGKVIYGEGEVTH